MRKPVGGRVGVGLWVEGVQGGPVPCPGRSVVAAALVPCGAAARRVWAVQQEVAEVINQRTEGKTSRWW